MDKKPAPDAPGRGNAPSNKAVVCRLALAFRLLVLK